MNKFKDRIFIVVIALAMVFTTVFTMPLVTAATELNEYTFDNLTLDEETTSITEDITAARNITYYYYYTPRTECKLVYEIETTGGAVQSIKFGKLGGDMTPFTTSVRTINQVLDSPNQKYVLSIVKSFDEPIDNTKLKVSAKLAPTELEFEQPNEGFSEPFKSEKNNDLRKFYRFIPDETCGYTFEVTPDPGADTSNTSVRVYSEEGKSLSYEGEYDEDFGKASLQVYLTKKKII